MLPKQLAKLVLTYINIKYKLFIDLAQYFNSIEASNIDYFHPNIRHRTQPQTELNLDFKSAVVIFERNLMINNLICYFSYQKIINGNSTTSFNFSAVDKVNIKVSTLIAFANLIIYHGGSKPKSINTLTILLNKYHLPYKTIIVNNVKQFDVNGTNIWFN